MVTSFLGGDRPRYQISLSTKGLLMQQLNKQKTESRSTSPLLQVHSIFETIQGEGPFSGTPCVFIRLSGCNLMCPHCDTDYTSKREEMTPQMVLFSVGTLRQNGLVVITGGEPFRQELSELIGWLVQSGYYVQIETNGTIKPSDGTYNHNIQERRGVYVVVSPKTEVIQQVYSTIACAFKYVISYMNTTADGFPKTVLGFPTRHGVARPNENFTGLIYIQPEDNKNKALNELNLSTAVNLCLDYGFILNLQVHKIIGVE